MKRWYVVQVFTGYEDIVKVDLEKRIKEEILEELFGQVLVPTGEVLSFFTDDKTKKEKIFPGYLLIQMEMVGESFRLVSSNPRVTRFLGGESPVSLTDKEVDRIFSQMSGKLAISSEKTPFTVGNEVHIEQWSIFWFCGYN